MLDVIVQSFGINLAYLILMLVIGWFILLWLDRRLARGRGLFAQHFQAMQANGMALAIYLGLRFVGICLIASAFIRG